MVIKYIKQTLVTTSLVGLLLLLTACPSESFCDLETPLIVRPDEVIITPEKRMFNTGESLKITISIPSKINDGENMYDINESLGVSSSNRSLNISEFLNENTFVVNKGQLDNFQIILDYFQDTDSYEFECEIILERKGNYRQIGNKELIAFVKNEENCEFIDVTTTIKGINEEGFYEFTVE